MPAFGDSEGGWPKTGGRFLLTAEVGPAERGLREPILASWWRCPQWEGSRPDRRKTLAVVQDPESDTSADPQRPMPVLRNFASTGRARAISVHPQRTATGVSLLSG